MRKSLTLILMSVFVLTLAACGGTNESEATENEPEEESEEVVVEHELGETTVEKNPENVVAFDFGSLDTLDKVDIDVAAVPKQNIPKYINQYDTEEYENVGSLKEPDSEKIAEEDSELIIISSRQADVKDKLTDIATKIHSCADD